MGVAYAGFPNGALVLMRKGIQYVPLCVCVCILHIFYEDVFIPSHSFSRARQCPCGNAGFLLNTQHYGRNGLEFRYFQKQNMDKGHHFWQLCIYQAKVWKHFRVPFKWSFKCVYTVLRFFSPGINNGSQ